MEYPCSVMLTWYTTDLVWKGSAESQHHLGGYALVGGDICAQLLRGAITLHQLSGLLAHK